MSYINHPRTARQVVASLSNAPLIGLDIETTPLKAHIKDKKAALSPHTGRIRLVQVATDSSTYVFDLNRVALSDLQPIFDCPTVAYNALFEYKFLTHYGIVFNNRLHDAMLLDRLINCKLRKLDAAVLEVLSIELDKAPQKSDWGQDPLTPEQLKYAHDDAVMPLQLCQKLYPLVEGNGQLPLYRLWLDNLPILGELSLRGQAFDWENHAPLCEAWVKEQKQLDAQIIKLLPEVKNYNSGQQLAAWLRANVDETIIRKWPETATGVLKTDANTLKLHKNISIIPPLLKIKALNKLISTYGKGYLKNKNAVTQNLHAQFILGRTRTGRLACNSPNTQNPPREDSFRRLFITEKGRVVIGADYSQIELRIAALLSNDKVMLNAYNNGADLHKETAQAITGCIEITPEQRQGAKAVNFGALYGQRGKGLAFTAKATYGVEMTVHEANKAAEAFSKKYPDLYKWQCRQDNKAQMHRQVSTPMGLVRDFIKDKGGYEFAEALNTPVQGGGSEVLLSAIKRIPELKHLGARLEHTVHDEILLSAPIEHAEETARELNRIMCEGFLDIFPQATQMLDDLVEVKIGATWADVH